MGSFNVRLPRFAAGVAMVFVSAALVRDAAAQSSTPDCRDAQECRELALEARARSAYETFHDLAWRAVQTGRPNDPDLMYLVARAQALSGRRRDAIVMLRRLAEAGYPNEAATDEDFRRVRELPEWQYIATLTGRPRPGAPDVAPPAAAAAKPAAPAPRPATAKPLAAAKPPVAAAPSPAAVAAVAPAPAAPPRSALRVEPATVEDAARFSTGRFAPGGLAYDAVSRRFLFGDRIGRRLFVVGEGSERTVDLVRADSAAFDEVTAIAIDPRRGHLWVASTPADGGGGALHHLQLISGRVLARLTAPGDSAMRLRDLTVAADGTVFILDSAAPRVLVLRPGATAIAQLMPLTTPDPTSIAVDEDGRLAFVTHREGIARLDIQARRATPLNAGNGIDLAGFEQIRWHRDVLVGSQIQSDGSRGFVRLQLNRDRSRVASATLIDTPRAADESTTLATISGSDLYYLVATTTESQGTTSVRVRRIKLP